jgi:hypothetical protein
MGWLIGCISNRIAGTTREKIAAVHPAALHIVSFPGMHVAAGGINQTCLSGDLSPADEKVPKRGWIVCGLGVRKADDHTVFLNARDWATILNKQKPDIASLDGHFVICRWERDAIEFFSDQMGMRTLYITQKGAEIYFSTRIDWITIFTGAPSIDFTRFGSRWITNNQLSQDCEINGISKLGQAGYARITPNGFHVENTLWKPGIIEDAAEQHVQHLTALTNPIIDDLSLSFSLSGGFDSRVVLSLLLKNNRDFGVHFFGDPHSPDVRIAREISQKEYIASVLFNDPIPTGDDCISLLKNYAAQAYICDPVTTILKLRYYAQLHAGNKFIMDGAFGELSRRVYFTRLLYRGRRALQSGNPMLIAPFLTSHRASIFNAEINSIMEKGMAAQLAEVWNAMPAISEFGEGNFMDLLILRTRVPNWGSHEQMRVDQVAVCYMPYLQPSWLNIVFSLPVSLRNRARLQRKILLSSRNSLARFPLAKGNSTYPYPFGNIEAWLWTRMTSRFGFEYKDPLKHRVFADLKPFIMDTLASASVRSYSPYDHQAIVTMVNDYYRGNERLANQLDWWLAFELWRQELGINT